MKNKNFMYTIIGGAVYVALSALIIGVFLYTGWLVSILLSSIVGMALGYRGSKLEQEKDKLKQFSEGFDWGEIEKSIQ